MRRLLTAAVFLPVFILVVGFLGPRWFFLLVAASLVLAIREVNLLTRGAGYRCRTWLCSLFSLGILYAFLDPRVDPLAAVAATLVILPLFLLGTREARDGELFGLGITVLTAVVLGVLLGYQVLLRGTGADLGRRLIFFLYLVVWIGDSAAYYGGRWLGRHPLVPRISPHKTIEGSVIGSLASMAAGGASAGWLLDGMGIAQGLAIGFILNGFGQAGDLLESVLKRAARVKDSASLLPGHGGILDRVDSLILTGPVFFFWWAYLLPRWP